MDETNPNPTPTPPVVPPTKTSHPMWVSIFGVLLILLAATLGYIYVRNHNNPPPPPAPTPVTQIDASTTPTTNEPLVSGMIKWQYPTSAYADFVFSDHRSSYDTYYNLGKVTTGKYAGSDVNIGLVPCDCLGGDQMVKYISRPAGSNEGKPFVLLQKYSAALDSFQGYLDSTKYEVDAAFTIPDLEAPTKIGSGSKELFLDPYSLYQPGYPKFNATNLKFVYNDPQVGAVYTTPDDPSKVDTIYRANGFYAKSPDWSILSYQVKPNFVTDDYKTQVTWNDGTQNTQQFVYTDRTGCGSNYASIALSSDVNVQNDLVKTGVTSKGDVIYELKDKNNKLLKDLYANDYNPYDQTKIPYDQFLTKHPLFFWVDPFGRLIKFKNNDFQPQAECGKPVIYLYPQKTENVSVKLAPVGGFTYTEPAYLTGWNVTATPEGTLTNLADGNTYPYLFWEGRGGLYQTPDKGFVVANSDVDSFLTQKLSQLGLNAKESADFKEYWEPYLTGSPYYFITFMGNQVMNQIAPLTVKPKPDTVIRILMDFKKLEKPIQVQGYNIQTPVRKGFTVVEWGGVKP